MAATSHRASGAAIESKYGSSKPVCRLLTVDSEAPNGRCAGPVTPETSGTGRTVKYHKVCDECLNQVTGTHPYTYSLHPESLLLVDCGCTGRKREATGWIKGYPVVCPDHVFNERSAFRDEHAAVIGFLLHATTERTLHVVKYQNRRSRDAARRSFSDHQKITYVFPTDHAVEVGYIDLRKRRFQIM